MVKKIKKKTSKEDLTAIALFYLAQSHNKKMDMYCKELITYLSKGKSKKQSEQIADWVWNDVFEAQGYDELAENLKGIKKNGK